MSAATILSSNIGSAVTYAGIAGITKCANPRHVAITTVVNYAGYQSLAKLVQVFANGIEDASQALKNRNFELLGDITGLATALGFLTAAIAIPFISWNISQKVSEQFAPEESRLSFWTYLNISALAVPVIAATEYY